MLSTFCANVAFTAGCLGGDYCDNVEDGRARTSVGGQPSRQSPGVCVGGQFVVIFQLFLIMGKLCPETQISGAGAQYGVLCGSLSPLLSTENKEVSPSFSDLGLPPE